MAFSCLLAALCLRFYHIEPIGNRRIYGNRLAKCLIIIYTSKPEEVDLYFPAHRRFALCCRRIRGIERETQRDIIDIFH